MTGFDTLMRSQSMMQQTQMGYDRMRYQMEQQAGQSLAQAPSNFLDGYKAAQDIRIQEQQAEMTARMSKLQITNLTEQTEQLKNQTALGAIAVKKAQYELDNLDQSRAQEIMRNRRDFVQKNTDAMMKMGYKPNDTGTGFVKMKPEELESYRTATGGGVAQGNLRLKSAEHIRLSLDALRDKYRTGVSKTFQPNLVSEQDRIRMRNMERELYDRFGEAYEGGGEGGSEGAAAAGARQAAEPEMVTADITQDTTFKGRLGRASEGVKQQFQSVAQSMNNAPEAASVLGQLDSESAGSMMVGLAQMADEQVKLGTVTPDKAASTVIDMFFNGNDAAVQAYVMAQAGLPDEQIEAYIMSRPYMQNKTPEQRKAAADFALKAVRQHVPAPAAPAAPASAAAAVPGMGGALTATPQPGDPGYIVGLDQSMTAQPASVTTPDAQAPQGEQFGPSAMSAFIPGGPGGPDKPEFTRPDQVVPQPGPEGALSAPPTEDQRREFAEQREVQPGQAPADKTTVPPVTRFVGDMEASWPYANTLDEPFKNVTTQLKEMGVSSAAMTPLVGGLRKRVDSLKRKWGKAEERKLTAKIDAKLKKLGNEILQGKLPADDRVKEHFKEVLQDMRRGSPANRADMLAQTSEQLMGMGPQVFDRLLDIQEENDRERRLAMRLAEDVNMELARLKTQLSNARDAQRGPLTPSLYKHLVHQAEKRIERLEKRYLEASGGK